MDSWCPFSGREEMEQEESQEGEHRGGRRRWAECEQWGRGVHLAQGPRAGLTAAGGALGCSL